MIPEKKRYVYGGVCMCTFLYVGTRVQVHIEARDPTHGVFLTEPGAHQLILALERLSLLPSDTQLSSQPSGSQGRKVGSSRPVWVT